MSARGECVRPWRTSLARQDLQLSQAPAKAGNGGALESLRTGGGRRGSWDLHLGTHREGRLLSPSV